VALSCSEYTRVELEDAEPALADLCEGRVEAVWKVCDGL
jgi:hypothetical protein